MNVASSGRYPLIVGSDRLPHQTVSVTGQLRDKEGRGSKTTPGSRVRTANDHGKIQRKSQVTKTGLNQLHDKTTSSMLAAQSHGTNVAPSKVNFYGGRPFQSRRLARKGPSIDNVTVLRKLDKTGNKTGQGYVNIEPNAGGHPKFVSAQTDGKTDSFSQPNTKGKKVLLKQANVRANLVKEIIREEAGPILQTERTSELVPGKVTDQTGHTASHSHFVDRNGALTINLYVHPQDPLSTHGIGSPKEPLIKGEDQRAKTTVLHNRPANKRPAAVRDTNKSDNSKSSPINAGSIPGSDLTTRPQQVPSSTGGQFPNKSLESLPSKHGPVERLPGNLPPPTAPSLSHYSKPIGIDEPSQWSPAKQGPIIAGTVQTPGHANANNQRPQHGNEAFRPDHDHLATAGKDGHSTRHSGTNFVNKHNLDIDDTESSLNSDSDNGLFGPQDFVSHPRWVDTPIEDLLDVRSRSGMERQHELKYYPRTVDSRAQFERRLEDDMQQGLRRGRQAPHDQNNNHRDHPRNLSQENLQDLSAKHYLASKSRLDSQASERYVEEPFGTRNMMTNTGTVQYVIRNSKPGSSSTVSTIPMDNAKPTLPYIHAHVTHPSHKKGHTKRVKDSEAQTEHNDDTSEVDEPLVQEIAIQTQKYPRQQQDPGSQAHAKDPLGSGVEIGIQTFDAPKEASTQTHDEPRTVATSTDDLPPPTPTPRKSVPPSPLPPMYRGQTMYKEIRDIIHEEGDPAARSEPPPLGVRFQDDLPQEPDAEPDLETEEELYVLYLKTDHGAIIGPLMIEIDDVQLGLPQPKDSDTDHVDSSRYEAAPETPPPLGLRNRQTGANSQNEHSSRSHSMLTVNINSEMPDPDDDNVYITKHGKLTFIDLAGSEKGKTDMATNPEHLVESNNINRSLLVLGNCISALSDKKKNGHVPYRDSKLTKLLADSLGGNGVTLMIACISPSSFNSSESMNTLRYANRAKKIKTKPIIKMDPRERLIVSLKREIKVLRQENHYLRQQLDFPVKPKGVLQKENDQKFLKMLKDHKKDGKISDNGLYEMLQEYMIENETLRTENTDLVQHRDQGRRDQQTLARENERLVRKLDMLEKERMLVHTPISMYSVGSTVSRRSSGVDSQFDQPEPPASWQQSAPYYKETQRGHKKTPPSHLQHPTRPPHRLSEPVNKNNPGYLDSSRPNGYANRYNNQQEYHGDNGQGAPGGPVPHQGASYPELSQSGNPPYNKGGPQTGNSKPRGRVGASLESQPVAAPRRSGGAAIPQGPVHSDHGNHPQSQDDDLTETESMAELNDRLRQELLDLEGQIKQQTRLQNAHIDRR